MSKISAILFFLLTPIFLLFFLEKIRLFFLKKITNHALCDVYKNITFYVQLFSLIVCLFFTYVYNIFFFQTNNIFFFITFCVLIIFFFFNKYFSFYFSDFFSVLISFYLFFFSYLSTNFMLIVLAAEITNVLILHLVYKNFKVKFRVSTSANIYYILAYNFIGSVLALFFLNQYLTSTGVFYFSSSYNSNTIFLFLFLIFKIGISPLFFYNFFLYKSLTMTQLV